MLDDCVDDLVACGWSVLRFWVAWQRLESVIWRLTIGMAVLEFCMDAQARIAGELVDVGLVVGGDRWYGRCR